MRLNKILASCSLMAVALSASASVELTFEDRGVGFTPLGNPYTGFTFKGTTAYSFGSAAGGGTGSFAGQVDAAHPVNNTALFFDNPRIGNGSAGQLVINVDAGFSTLFKMLYTTYDAWLGTNVQIFSGLDGTGTLLGSSGAFSTIDQTGCAVSIACKWGQVNIDLDDNIAHSVVIKAPDAVYFFDNFFFGDLATVPGGDVPEPTGTALTLAALGALAITRRRKQASR